MSAKKTDNLPQVSDKKLFRALILIGISLWVVGLVLSLVLGAFSKGDFNFLPAIIAFFGVIIIALTLIYSLFKLIVNRLKNDI